MTMLRLVRFILMVAISAFLFSVWHVQIASSSLSLDTPTAQAACSIWIFNCDNPTQVPYCNSNDPSSPNYCSLDKGTDIVKNNISDINKDKKFSDYIQGVIAYLLSFLSLIVVILILWAGFKILTAGDDTDKVKSAKSTIVYALIGVVLIFLAWAITTFILGDSTRSKGLINATAILQKVGDTFSVSEALAATNDGRGFEYYSSKIQSTAQDIGRDYEVDGKVKITHLQDLQSLVTQSMETFPESNKDINTSLANNVLTQIALVKKFPDSDLYTDRLAGALRDFLTNIKIGTITAKITATPVQGNAPLTTTLRAVEARDPSGVTIPDSNYVWWIRGPGNTRKVLGKGPSIPWRFDTEAVYTVNLEILSASRNAKGRVDVMPFQGTQEVRVLPRLANILLYMNGANVSSNEQYKITPNQGRVGIIIDATSSTPAAGATILKTEWDFGNGNRISYNGAPKLERQVYASEGVYTLRLKITTNESPEGIVKELRIISQDPIASIRADKTTGYAGDDFKFQATSNLVNTMLSYEWNILESDSGKNLFSMKGQVLNYKFPRMGNYVVKLKTTSAGWKEDVDNIQIRIDSKDPIANFDVAAASSETPNTVRLDATRSYDPDSMDASKLQFNWTIDGERVELDNSARNGAIGLYTFSTKGNHTIVLDLTNEQGKTTQAKKEFRVESLLSVKLIPTPKIGQLGNPVALVAESKEANVFEWDFGDSTNENTSESRAFHTYKKAGVYDVRLTVRGNPEAGASNTITRKVYITDADSPFAAISVKKDQDAIEMTSGACPSGDAYVIDRTKPVRVTAEESVNTDGTTTGLTYAWKYQGKTSTQKDFSYKFDELGCFPVTLTVRSQKANKTHTSTVYVKVENAVPTFASLSVTSDKIDADPVVVNVAVNNATDPDGVIVSYLWYYYTDSDPEPQDFRITRSPKTVFVVPRINGKYYFAVTMEDSNGAKVNSEESREERYSITLASDNINTPLIQLKASTSQAKVSEEVTFQASAKNVVGQDLSDKAEYKWDYDGDGFYDETTSAPTVKHVYEKPGNYNMKVKVSYKGISNTRYQQISVRNDLVPNLEYFAIGNRYVFMNTTTGVYTKVKWTVGPNTSENRDSYVVNLDEDTAAPEVVLEVSDGTDTKVTRVPLRKDVVNAARMKDSKETVQLMTYPSLEGDTLTVDRAGERVFLYLGESQGVARYQIDTDIKTDSDLNGEPSDDADNKGTDSYATGAPFLLKNLDSQKERTMRISLFDASGKKIASRDVKLVLNYIDANALENAEKSGSGAVGLSDADKASMETLKDMIRTKTPEGERVKYMQLLSQLQDNWNDQTAKTKAIIDFQQALAEGAVPEADKNQFLTILDGFLLSDSETKDDIALATSVLRKLIPSSNPHYEEIFGKDGKSGLVGEILSHPTNTELNKTIGEKILKYIKDDENISNEDKLILKEQLRVIIQGGAKNVEPDTSTQTESAGIGALLLNVLIGFGWILGILVLAALLLFIFFKVTNRNANMGFQDFLIEKIFGKPSTPTPVASPISVAPSTPAPVQPIVTPPVPEPRAIDPLAEVSQPKEVSPARQEAFKEIPKEESIEPSQAEISESSEKKEDIEITSEQGDSDGIPDWLKTATERHSEESSVAAEATEGSSIIDKEESSSAETVAETVSATQDVELPDWLKNFTPASPVETEVSDTKEVPQASLVQETPESQEAEEVREVQPSETPSPKPSRPKAPKTKTKPTATDIRPTASTDDLPDWLK